MACCTAPESNVAGNCSPDLPATPLFVPAAIKRIAQATLFHNHPGLTHPASTTAFGPVVMAINGMTAKITQQEEAPMTAAREACAKMPTMFYGDSTIILNWFTPTHSVAGLPHLHTDIAGSTKKNERI